MDSEAVMRAWDEVAATYARRRDPDGSDAALIDDLLADLPPAPLVLDAGCGDGARTLANLPDDAVGLDVSRAGLALARERAPGSRLVHGEMSRLPIRTASIDGITAYHAVFHVPREDQPTVYREFARVLRPGGRLLMTLPGGRYETVRRGWMDGDMFFSTPGREATLAQLEDAEFRVDRTVTADDPLGSGTEFVFAIRED
ncbi:class I SAM-dependent methyltransferase [Halobaculum rubrum]|uniref:class I SAM-dependent methyltransferase n=1 Tax=Halobaculum rubrum TaxID=2872158 RepID=UPI001CA45D4B|nr:class I SAM-dependent methyltransferase [Halobaculum rubrum]QZY00996.1 class I SAM-dependent methyltransferase [Halobaculum rubrum]